MNYQCPSSQLTDEGYKKFKAHKNQIEQELTEQNLNKIEKDISRSWLDYFLFPFTFLEWLWRRFRE